MLTYYCMCIDTLEAQKKVISHDIGKESMISNIGDGGHIKCMTVYACTNMMSVNHSKSLQ